MLNCANDDGNAARAATATRDFLLKSMVNEMLCIMKLTEMKVLLRTVGKIPRKIP